MPNDYRAFNKEVKTAFDDIERLAFENYLLELVKKFGIAYDGLNAKYGFCEEKFVLLDAKLDGKFPTTVIAMKFRRPDRDEKGWRRAALWQDPIFFNDKFERRSEPEDIAAEILRWFRGD